MNPNLERLARETGADVGPDERLKTPDGFTYVPILKMMVADNLQDFGYSWMDIKKKFSEQNIHMLTPEEWWVYYEFCMKERPDLKDGFRYSEFLDAIAYEEDEICIAPEYKNGDVDGGTSFDLQIVEPGYFDPEDIDPVTGLPKQLTDGAEWYFTGIKYPPVVFIRRSFVLDLDKCGPNGSGGSAGARVCYKK
jgi:hypothetical protein